MAGRFREKQIRELEKTITKDYLVMTSLSEDVTEKQRERATANFVAHQKKMYSLEHRYYTPSQSYIKLKRKKEWLGIMIVIV